MTSPDVRLKIDGREFGGWKRISIRRGLEQLAATFELTVTERWAGQDVVRPIVPGVTCTLLVNGSPIINGYVDDIGIDYDDKSHGVIVSGRDKTGDLIDCSAPSTQFSGRTIAEVATDLCKPFGVGVKVATDIGGPFSRLKNNEGDSVFETLEPAARVRAILLLSDGLGNLVLARAGTQRIKEVLELGRNVLRASGSSSHRDRFSRYQVKGQMAGTDEWNAEDAAHPFGTATDNAIKRHRPLTVLAEEQVDETSAKERAEWERNVRYGRSRRISYTVKGWHHSGDLWQPGFMVPVRDKFLGVSDDRLISGVDLLLDDKGFNTKLDLLPRQSFERMELPEPGEDEAW
jgi:prophage tail gpP-like protein